MCVVSPTETPASSHRAVSQCHSRVAAIVPSTRLPSPPSRPPLPPPPLLPLRARCPACCRAGPRNAWQTLPPTGGRAPERRGLSLPTVPSDALHAATMLSTPDPLRTRNTAFPSTQPRSTGPPTRRRLRCRCTPPHPTLPLTRLAQTAVASASRRALRSFGARVQFLPAKRASGHTTCRRALRPTHDRHTTWDAPPCAGCHSQAVDQCASCVHHPGRHHASCPGTCA